MTSKVLTPMIDKNGHQTARWMNTQSSALDRSKDASTPPVVAGKASVMPSTITVLDSQRSPVTLSTSDWGFEAERVYSEGQCAAFGYQLKKDWYPDATLKAAMNMSGTTLIHVWLEEDGMIIDAQGAYRCDEETYIEELYYSWGTPEITDHTPESLKSFMESQGEHNQSWGDAAHMIPAWVAAYDA